MAQEHGFTKNSFEETRQELLNKFSKEPEPRDVIWALYNKLIGKINTPNRLTSTYYSMALFLNKEGEEHSHVLRLSHQADLKGWKADGVTVFEVNAESGCESCKKLHGEKLNYNSALKEGILPCKNCTNVLYKGKNPFCRCRYNPIIK